MDCYGALARWEAVLSECCLRNHRHDDYHIRELMHRSYHRHDHLCGDNQNDVAVAETCRNAVHASHCRDSSDLYPSSVRVRPLLFKHHVPFSQYFRSRIGKQFHISCLVLPRVGRGCDHCADQRLSYWILEIDRNQAKTYS
ncbi:hypothetical protein PMAYCL1PPCAC_16453, partial [Pristionchus mayeri]